MSNSSIILTADFGSVTTRVLLLSVVGGEYRVVANASAPTSIGAPFNDVSVGLRRILHDITNNTGRQFYDQAGQIIRPESDGRGVDMLALSASAGRPMRVFVMGLLESVSLRSAIRALAGNSAEVVGQIHISDGLTETERLNALLLSQADLIIVAGGSERGAQAALVPMIQVLRLAMAVTDSTLRPSIIYAGNSALAPLVKEKLSPFCEVLFADNLRPAVDDEQLASAQAQVNQAYARYKTRQSASFGNVAALSELGLLPTAQGYALLTRYFAALHRHPVLAVDMGSANTIVVACEAGELTTYVNPQAGLGHSALSLLERLDPQALRDWIPFYVDDAELRAYAINKTLRPLTIPMTQREGYLEHALLRAGVQAVLGETSLSTKHGDPMRFGTLVVGGAPLAQAGDPRMSLLLAADAVQPTGVTEVYADTIGLVPALGVLAQTNPTAVVQLIEGGDLAFLGTLVSISGQPKIGKGVARITATVEGETIKTQLKGGDLTLLPVPAGVSFRLSISLAPGLTIGGKRRLRVTLRGGLAGVLLDARGRSLRVGADPAERAERLPRWLHQATELEPMSIPPEWLQTPLAPASEASAGADDLFADVVDSNPRRRRGAKTEKPAKAGRGAKPRQADIAAATEVDDEFAALLDESPAQGQTGKLSDPAARKRTTEENDIGNLRDLL